MARVRIHPRKSDLVEKAAPNIKLSIPCGCWTIAVPDTDKDGTNYMRRCPEHRLQREADIEDRIRQWRPIIERS